MLAQREREKVGEGRVVLDLVVNTGVNYWVTRTALMIWHIQQQSRELLLLWYFIHVVSSIHHVAYHKPPTQPVIPNWGTHLLERGHFPFLTTLWTRPSGSHNWPVPMSARPVSARAFVIPPTWYERVVMHYTVSPLLFYLLFLCFWV